MQKQPKQAIHRFTLEPTVDMPIGAIFLDCQVGSSGPSMWFIVDPHAEKEKRTFAMIATGQPLPDAIMDAKHLATIKAILIVKAPGADEAQATPTALHIFDTTHLPEKARAEIPFIDMTKPMESSDPADWWKAEG